MNQETIYDKIKVINDIEIITIAVYWCTYGDKGIYEWHIMQTDENAVRAVKELLIADNAVWHMDESCHFLNCILLDNKSKKVYNCRKSIKYLSELESWITVNIML